MIKKAAGNNKYSSASLNSILQNINPIPILNKIIGLKLSYAFIPNFGYGEEIDNLFLEIKDDGIGFNVNKAKKGIGLQNMLSRINECEGTFEIKSKKGEGTIITVTVPI